MRKTLLLQIFVLVALSACGQSARVGKFKPGGGDPGQGEMSAETYNKVLELNRMQQDNIDARDIAIEEFRVFAELEPFASEKARKMSESLGREKCGYSGSIPDKITAGQYEQIVGGESGSACPIFWSRHQGYHSTHRIVTFADDLEIRDDLYRKNWSRFTARRLKGTFGFQPSGNGGTVSGTININEFQTLDYGPVSGRIVIANQRQGMTGSGSIEISLIGRGWSATGRMLWQIRNNVAGEPSYRIANQAATRTEFMDLFSAYAPDKFMANAIDMK